MAGVARRATILFGAALAVALLLAFGEGVTTEYTENTAGKQGQEVKTGDRIAAQPLAALRSELGLRADADVRMATVGSAAPVRTNDAPDALELSLTLADTPDSPTTYTLNLRKHSNRAPDMFVRVYGANGEYEDRAPGPVRTYRGEVIDTTTGAVTGEVAGSLDKDGQLRGRLTMTGEDEQWIEPVKRDNGAVSEHIIYKAADIKLDQPFTCGVSGEASRHQGIKAQREEQNAAPSDPLMPWSLDASVPSVFDLHCANIGCDVDVEYFQNFNSVEEAQQRIEDIINIANIQYEHQIQITHRIALIVIRTEEPDPYPMPDLLLLRSEWETEFGDVDWDLVHLFSGHENAGFGFANIEGICQSSNRAFSFVGFLAGPQLSLATDVTEHEIGHNWGATHCCPGSTMSPGIGSAEASNFAQESINQMIAYRDGRPCLEMCDVLEIATGTLPLIDNFDEADFASHWSVSGDAQVDDDTAVLTDASLTTVAYDTSTLFAVDVSYDIHSVANDGELVLEYQSRAYNWIPFLVHGPTDASTVVSARLRLDGAGDFHPARFEHFRMRFRSAGATVIDGVSFAPLITDPCPEDCVFGDGVVDIADLLQVLLEASSGNGVGCDVTPPNADGTIGNDITNIDDLLAVLRAFGPCE